MQRRNGLFWGIALVTLGLLLVARNAGWLAVDWHSLVNLWPVLLILAGVNLILERRGNPAAFVTTVLLAIAVPTTLFGFFARNRDRSEYNFRWNDHDRDDNSDEEDDQSNNDEADDNAGDKNTDDAYHAERDRRATDAGTLHVNTFSETMDADTRDAVLKLSGGAGKFFISDPTTELIKADTKQTISSYSMSVDRDPTTHTPTIELKPTDDEQHVDLDNSKFENRVDVHLNAKPVWTMDIGLGAGQGELDLSSYNMKSLKLAAGAADIDLKLGAKADQSEIKLDIGAALVTIHVPKEVGCRIKKDGALNINQLDDFTDVGGGEFVSPGYDAAKKKITVRFDGGMSKLKVVRY